jgi:hypothetical protein
MSGIAARRGRNHPLDAAAGFDRQRMPLARSRNWKIFRA